MSSDQELDPDQLPRGQTPIWIQPPKDASQIEMMERVLKIPELAQYNNNVTVMYDYWVILVHASLVIAILMCCFKSSLTAFLVCSYIGCKTLSCR